MNTKLSAVSDKRMDLTCSACGHEFSYKIADLILATSDTSTDYCTTHEVRQRAVCRGCGVRGDNTYFIYLASLIAVLHIGFAPLLRVCQCIQLTEHNGYH